MKRLITLILAIALCVPLYIPVQAEYRYMMTTILRHLVAFLMMRYITLIWKWRGFILMQYGERVRPNAIIAILMHGMTNRLKTMFGLLILFRT